MKKIILFLLVFSIGVVYADFSKMPNNGGEILQQGVEKEWCPICGMKLKMYYKTNHAVELKDGNFKQYCSIRCLAFDYENIKANIKEILVVDVSSDKFINAKSAYYVMGSNVPGTMTKVSKLAFKEKKDAEKFKNEYGGDIVDFDTAFKSALDSLNSDVAFFRAKKEKMMYPMGEKIYKSACGEISLSKYKKISELKADIANKKICGDLEEKQLQAVALYLWEVKRFEGNISEQIVVDKKEKCPVCGMFVYKYPNWAAEIVLENGLSYYFDGVKDMMKFYFEPEKFISDVKGKKISKIKVTDYYTLKTIDGKKAYYVIGSSVYGPMGKELIPFVTESDAKHFMADYGGTKILKFEEITKELVYDLDK